MKKAFDPIIFPESKILILGTMPGEKSLGLQQYYGNRGNQFWKILFTLFRQPFTTDYELRKNLLKNYDIALWDVLQYCEREGSLDSKIKNEQPNDFNIFYKKFPNVKYVFFSSKNAYAYYNKYIGLREELVYDILPSPSGANASMPFLKKLAVWEAKILPLVNKQ
ncbi:DNA-deoxyinosine glycosylase [Flavobacterium salilacus subsp. salilacus]|uniref:DNA-deoxyinosine glycosylase n=1 Tax=Flavobacterium TaxID=237 RepID=UPI0010752CBE|nr:MULTISPECIES: DNA-deoxyinosine glycosylase [Flavobacterium]KAF2518696.1 DNA-deoxyinosine glycosylase [Flavobacterium salilacus subsp. salilacus]MBE1613660.1 DNA-deoxyinosine glycosylase [Flavobacterium sp. SaA2.13]